MASCSLGASNIKVPTLNLGNGRAGNLQPRGDVRNWMGMKPQPYPSMAISCPTEKAFRVSCGPSSETGAVTSVRNGVEEKKSSDLTNKLIPNSSEVESLVSEICDSTSIAEFELNLKGFRLHLTRNLSSNTEPPPPPPPPLSPAPVSVTSASDATASNGSASSTSSAISKLVSSFGRAQTFLDKAADEGFTILPSPKVGFFRRSRTIKGKRAPPPCKEKQEVKEGQVLCYIEQLGGEIPIESDISGEVIKILKNDGDPVGYGDALIAILPSFPGIKKLQ